MTEHPIEDWTTEHESAPWEALAVVADLLSKDPVKLMQQIDRQMEALQRQLEQLMHARSILRATAQVMNATTEGSQRRDEAGLPAVWSPNVTTAVPMTSGDTMTVRPLGAQSGESAPAPSPPPAPPPPSTTPPVRKPRGPYRKNQADVSEVLEVIRSFVEAEEEARRSGHPPASAAPAGWFLPSDIIKRMTTMHKSTVYTRLAKLRESGVLHMMPFHGGHAYRLKEHAAPPEPRPEPPSAPVTPEPVPAPGRATRSLREAVRDAIRAMPEEPFTARQVANKAGFKSTGSVQACIDALTGNEVRPVTHRGELMYVRLPKDAPNVRPNGEHKQHHPGRGPEPGTGRHALISASDKEIDALLQAAQHQGFEVRRLGNGHVRVQRDGEFADVTVSAARSYTPEVTRAKLRKLGVKL